MLNDGMMDKIMKQLEDHERRISHLERIPQKIESKDKKLSLKEFMLMKQPSDDVQKTLIIGYYLEHFEGMSAFNTKDLAQGFRSAREPVPININDKVNLNIAKGYMMSAEEKKDKLKAWILTSSGENFVTDISNAEDI